MSETKYHISNGEPKPCSAQAGNCPVGGAHYETVDKALSAIEKFSGGPLPKVLSKPKKPEAKDYTNSQSEADNLQKDFEDKQAH